MATTIEKKAGDGVNGAPPLPKPANGFMNYFLKDFLLSMLAALAGGVSSYFIASSIENLKDRAGPIGFVVGGAAGFLTSFGGWGKSEEKRLGLENVLNLSSADSPTSPEPLLKESEQVQRELQRIIDTGAVASHQEKVMQTPVNAQIAR